MTKCSSDVTFAKDRFNIGFKRAESTLALERTEVVTVYLCYYVQIEKEDKNNVLALKPRKHIAHPVRASSGVGFTSSIPIHIFNYDNI